MQKEELAEVIKKEIYKSEERGQEGIFFYMTKKNNSKTNIFESCMTTITLKKKKKL